MLSISELETPGNWFSIIGMIAEIALADVRTKEMDNNAVLNHILFLIFIKLLTSSLCYLASGCICTGTYTVQIRR